jgi:hypothetical protein
VNLDRVAVEPLDPVGGRLQQLVRQVRQGARGGGFLTDDRHTGIARRALGLAEAMKSIARQFEDASARPRSRDGEDARDSTAPGPRGWVRRAAHEPLSESVIFPHATAP